VTGEGHAICWKLFRMGYYAGLGGREIASGGPVIAPAQVVPVPDPVTGLVECHWPVTFTIPVPADAVTGAYLVKLTRDDDMQSLVIFVVRDDGATGKAVVEIPTATYAAYDRFGGESLYAD